VLILGAVVDQEAEPGRRETLDEAVKKCLGLGSLTLAPPRAHARRLKPR
jgi:hypothetical protein